MEELVYQMFILGTGECLKKTLIKGLGGVIFFTRDIKSVDQFKKSSKLSKEEISEMSDTIDRLTQKIYGRSLLSPQDNETLIGIKIKLDNQMLMATNPALAPLYYKAGNVYKLRDMKPEAIECYQTILENFSDTALAPKAKNALEQMGVEVSSPSTNEEENAESDEGI